MARKSRKGVVTPEKPQKAAMKIWRAALYIRLSVEFNGKRGDSLETQRQIMETYTSVGHKQVPTNPVNWIVVRNTHPYSG